MIKKKLLDVQIFSLSSVLLDKANVRKKLALHAQLKDSSEI